MTIGWARGSAAAGDACRCVHHIPDSWLGFPAQANQICYQIPLVWGFGSRLVWKG